MIQYLYYHALYFKARGQFGNIKQKHLKQITDMIQKFWKRTVLKKKLQTSKSPTMIFFMPQTSNILCYPSKYAWWMHASTFNDLIIANLEFYIGTEVNFNSMILMHTILHGNVELCFWSFHIYLSLFLLLSIL